jgi:hypothetical protein
MKQYTPADEDYHNNVAQPVSTDAVLITPLRIRNTRLTLWYLLTTSVSPLCQQCGLHLTV